MAVIVIVMVVSEQLLLLAVVLLIVVVVTIHTTSITNGVCGIVLIKSGSGSSSGCNTKYI